MKEAISAGFSNGNIAPTLAYGVDAEVLLADVSDENFFYDFGRHFPRVRYDVRHLDRHVQPCA